MFKKYGLKCREKERKDQLLQKVDIFQKCSLEEIQSFIYLKIQSDLNYKQNWLLFYKLLCVNVILSKPKINDLIEI